MSSGNSLADATLDTLPITVAVIDETGEILLTNRSWREFGPDDATEHVGVDYIATARMDDDEHARRAVEGLEAVIDGKQETFSMEYPCHTPERKRWFLMRASRFTVDDEVRVSIVHLEITERKLAEMAAEETTAELREEHQALEHVLERVDGLLRDVTDAAVGARTRDEIERNVCTRLVETEPYVLAWIGRVDVTNQRLSPREWASSGDIPLEDGDLVLASDESHPAVRALTDDEPAVIGDLETFDDANRWWPTGAGDRFRSVAALPLTYGDVTYGVLVLFSADEGAFSDRELLVLDSLSDTIATGMNAIESRRMLTTDSVVELEVEIEDSSLFVAALANALEATVTYRGQTEDEAGTPIVFVHADRAVDTVPPVSEIDGVSDVTVLSTYDGESLLEVTVDDDIVTALSDHGATVRRFDTGATSASASGRSGGETVDLTIALPNGQSARSIYDLLESRYDVVELISYHETDRPTRTPMDVMARLESSLTDRQLTALQTAYYAEYFEWPRNVSGEDLAESMGISRSTFHQHLRSAQRKLLDELFADPPTSEG
ncbi:bacterio-opsin activator domain-containing protein [Natronolimnohabitans sp. A-GB9]|uniref:bacterio-opsin activator domain-containing protein n=1 Tax=Natronolimnohabitans sp. A-GB9 TaxID=3069757 RepID=UPI0027B66299|nr:bacterio-opsin activator domain-containing protein [Natronolimnohabitans sp. A-GB9]MDQ2051267.1 bacterio-opsin activator domain-containing protein [Natronolimnohabitans sp. A-GB9]